MADFPNAVKNFLTLVDGVDKVIAAHPNDRGGEVTAIETLLGGLGSTQVNNDSYANLLRNYRRGCDLVFDTIAQTTLTAGEVMLTDASGNKVLRRNTSNLTVTWADIDTGAEANNTYYIYAVGDSSGTNFTALISLNSATPTGATFFKRLGSFVNSGGNIVSASIANDNVLTLNAAAVSRDKIKTATVEVSHASTSNVLKTLTGAGSYGFWLQIKASDAVSRDWGVNVAREFGTSNAFSTSYATHCIIVGSAAGTLFAQMRYVTALSSQATHV